MRRVLDWAKQHWYIVGAGVLALVVFFYLASRKSSGGSLVAGLPATNGVAGGPVGGDVSQGGLNLTSGTGVNLPPNLLPPTCPDGQIATPTMVSGGEGMPSFLLGWQCTDAPSIPVPSPAPAPTPAPTPAPAPAPAPPPPTPARTQTVCPWPQWCGSLWGIAQHYYGNGAMWQRIYEANKGLIGSNPNLIHPGQNLVIP